MSKDEKTVEELKAEAREKDIEGRSSMSKDELVEALEEADVKDGVEDFSIEQEDGATALLRLGDEVRRVRQSDLHRIEKQVSAAIQVTYY